MKKRRKRRIGKNGEKILLILLGGIALSCTRSPSHYYKIFGSLREEWKNINCKTDYERAIDSLVKNKFVRVVPQSNGAYKMQLTKNGRKEANIVSFDNVEIEKPDQWDEKWRVVTSDIPEKRKDARDALRYHLKRLRFVELHKSVYVHPYACEDEVAEIVLFHRIQKHLIFIVADSISEDVWLRKHFKLS